MLLALGPTANAASPDVFEVRGVAVDATADSAAAAREQALREGQVRAFGRLLRRLTLQDDHGALPNLDFQAVTTYMRDFSVSDEKTSDVRYLADLHVRFRPDDVRSLLREFGIPFAETASRPVVVLPVLEGPGGPVLWQDPNPWRVAWSKVAVDRGLVPMVLPIGDLDDVREIGAEEARRGDTAPLAAIAERYEAGSAAVVHAIPSGNLLAPEDDSGGDAAAAATARGASLEVRIGRYDSGEPGESQSLVLSPRPDEPADAFFARAAQETAAFIEDSWKRQNLIRFSERAVLPALVAIESLPHWLDIRDRLSRVTLIKRMELVLLSPDEARLNLHYVGRPEQLRVALEQNGLRLEQRSGVWYVARAAKAASSGNDGARNTGDGDADGDGGTRHASAES